MNNFLENIQVINSSEVTYIVLVNKNDQRKTNPKLASLYLDNKAK